MSKWMPPKLELYRYLLESHRDFSAPASAIYDHAQKQINAWYDKEIRPLFENAVEVYGDGRIDNGFWSPQENDRTINQTHKALLIKVEPIREETAEDLLRGIVECPNGHDFYVALNKAKAFLKGKKK